ncbi:hypothetical protein HK101_011574 [Irineochytrium annulatum]|nr:hypothetical protein HK101_011574 [Irineochytrium annulatum]
MLISRVARAGGGVESGPGAISDEDEIPLATLQRRKAALRLKNSIPVNDIGRNGKGIAALNIGKTDEQTEKPLGALSMRKEAPKSPPVRSYGRSSTAVKEEISHSPPVPSYRRPRTVVSLPKKEARFPTQTLLKRHVVDAFPVIVCNGFRIWDQRGLDLYTAINDYVAVALLDVGRIMEERLGIEVDADAIYDPVTLHLKVFSDTERPVHVRWFPEWHFDYVDHKSGIVRKDTKTVPFVSVKRGFHGTPAVAFDMRNRDHIHRLVPPGTRLNVGVMASLIICTTSTSWNARSDPEIGEFLPKLVDELRREHANDCCVLFERSSEITININPEDTPLPAWIPAAGKYKGSGNASVRWPLPKRPDFLPPPVESLKKPWRKHDSSPLPMPATNVPKQQNLASSDNVGFRMEDMPSASSSQAKQTDKAAAEKTLERRPTRHVTRVSTKEPRADKADRAQSDGPKLLCSDDMDARIKIGSAAQAAGGISLKRRPSTGTETGLKKARSDLPDDRLRSSEEVDARIKNRLSAEEDSLKRRPSTEIAPGAKKARSVVNVVGVVGDAAVNKRAMRRATMPSIVARWIVGPSLEATPGHAKGWEAESRSAALDEGHFENASDAGRSRSARLLRCDFVYKP